MIHKIPFFVSPRECDGLSTILHLPVVTSAHIWIAHALGILVIPSTGVRGCKLKTDNRHEGTCSMVIPMKQPFKKNNVRYEKMQRGKAATDRNVWVILNVLTHVIKVCCREILDGGSTSTCETPRKTCCIGTQKVIGDNKKKQGLMISLNTNTQAESRFQCRTITKQWWRK